MYGSRAQREQTIINVVGGAVLFLVGAAVYWVIRWLGWGG